MISTFKSFMQPRYVALCVDVEHDKDIFFRAGDAIALGETIASCGARSTVSGTVNGIVKMHRADNCEKHAVLIENDYRDRVHPSLASRDQADLVREYFVPVSKLERFPFDREMPLIVDYGFANEPFVNIDRRHAIEHADACLAALSFLQVCFPSKHIECLLPEGLDIERFTKSTLPLSFRQMPAERSPETTYRHIEAGFPNAFSPQRPYRYLNYFSLIRMQDMIRHHRPPISSTLVASGDGYVEPCVLTVRIGTLYEEVIDIVKGYAVDTPKSLHRNALIENATIRHSDFALDAATFSLHCEEHRELERADCNACGQCNDICPARILPAEIVQATQSARRTRRYKSELCVACGLCGYICPAKIDVKTQVLAAQKEGR